MRRRLERCIETGSAYTVEDSYDVGTGTLMWTRSTFAPMHDESGRISHLLCVWDDITEHRRVMERAQREKWNVVCLDLGIDLSTPQGQLMANVMASFAAYERELIRQRTRDALQALDIEQRPLRDLGPVGPIRVRERDLQARTQARERAA